MAPTGIEIPSLKGKVSHEEWAVRVDLAACYRLLVSLRLGGSDLHPHHRAGAGRRGSIPHQSVRGVLRRDHGLEPGQDRPAGQEARRLAVSGESGGLRHPQRHPRRAPRRPLRTPHAHRSTASPCRRSGPGSCRSRSTRCRCCRASATTTSKAWRARRREAAPGRGPRRQHHLILRNHGLITVGETVADAFVAMYFLESSCAIQVRAQSGGGELIPVPKEVLDAAYARPGAAARPRRVDLAGAPAAARSHRSFVQRLSRAR